MNKLIDLEITNNKLNLKFDNAGYIKLTNLSNFDYQIKNCDDDWHNKLHQNISNFLKNNFIIYNVEEFNANQETEYFKLSNIFDEIKKEEIDKTCKKNELFIKTNIDALLSAIKNRLKNDEFNFVIAYFMGNYDFVVLKDGSQIKTTASLKTAIRNYIENEIAKIFEKYQLDDCVCNLKLIQEFCPFVKSKRLTYKVEAEQIGPDHEKRWQISNFSFQQLN